MKRKCLLYLVPIVIMAANGCRKQPGQMLSKDTLRIVRANSVFAIDLYKSLYSSEGNLFISPYSISLAMSMTYAGARGETEKQIVQTLHYPLDQNDCHSSFASIQSVLDEIQIRDNIKLNIANSLWAQQGYPFRKEYLSLAQQKYGASIMSVNFNSAPTEAINKINQWVKEKTDGKIQGIIAKLPQESRLLLINAIYFKADWKNQFSPGNTMGEEFWFSRNNSVIVPTLHKTMRGPMYAEFENLQVLELPYVGENISMLILLPKEIDGLKQLEAGLSLENLDKWKRGLKRLNKNKRIELSLPKFKIPYELNLIPSLKAMGMIDAFSFPSADFSGMTGKKDIYLALAVHKTFIELNEKGTEAGAVTAMGGAGLVEEYDVIDFQANHPFLFVITDKLTGSILFMGRLTDPTKT